MRFIVYLISFILFIELTLPKQNLYYKIEEILQKYDIIIDKEEFNNKFFGFELHNLNIYYKGIKSVNIKEIKSKYYFISLKDIRLDDTLKDMIPQNIKTIIFKIDYKKPYIITIYSFGDFGKIDGQINVLDRKIKIFLQTTKTIQKRYKKLLLGKFKYHQGKYIYEYQF